MLLLLLLDLLLFAFMTAPLANFVDEDVVVGVVEIVDFFNEVILVDDEL